MDNVKKMYQDQFRKHGNSLESIFIPKGRQTERFDSLTALVKRNDAATLLDFGCGLGHLEKYVSEHFTSVKYEGCDIVEEFVDQSAKNFPRSTFYTIKHFSDVKIAYDYIVAAGVFNLLYSPSHAEHVAIVEHTIQYLFSKTKQVLSVNFMTDDVDFIAEGAYHQNINTLCDFARKNLTKRFIIDQSYMPYEFTIHLFKDDEILRPDNVFKPL